MSRDPSAAEWNRLRAQAFRAPWLSAERESGLLARAQAGEAPALAELCSSHLRLIVQIASRYRNAGLSPGDLVGEGSLGLIEAIRRFDLSQPTRLSTYAAWWIRARVREFVYAQRSMVCPPSTRGVRIARARLANAERALSHKLNRTPTRAELAAALEVTEEDIATVSATLQPAQSSPPFEAGIELRDQRAGPEEELASHESRRLCEQSVHAAVASLAERDRRIIRAHFLEDEVTMSDLGQTLGVTRQRVSQIVKRVRKQLARDLSRVAHEATY